MININRTDLIAALEAVKGCVASKTFQPILTHVLIDRDTVMAFDSEVGVRVKLGQDCGGTFNLRFDALFNLMRALDGDVVTFVLEGAKIRISCGQHKSVMMQIEDKFPQPDSTRDTTPSQVASGFKEALERCLVAASDSETEKVLSSVLVRGCNIMSTNRRMVVKCSLDPMAPLPEMLLSRKSVTELIRLGQPASVRLDGAWSIWDYGNLKLLARLREGVHEFPPVENLIEERVRPPSFEEMDKVPDGLLAQLTRLDMFTGKDGSVIARHTAFAVELTGRSELGDINEYIDAENEKVPAGKAFSPADLARALPFGAKMSWGKSVQDPIVLRGTDANFIYLQSPKVG